MEPESQQWLSMAEQDSREALLHANAFLDWAQNILASE